MEVSDFGRIIERIAYGLVEFVAVEPRMNPPFARRTFFRVRVSESDYDAFFNSPVAEFHDYKSIERGTGVRFYFATRQTVGRFAQPANRSALLSGFRREGALAGGPKRSERGRPAGGSG